MQHCTYQMGLSMAASEESRHPFSVSTGWHLDSPITNSINNDKIPLKMVCASLCIPKDDPKNPRGDDAHFVSAESQVIGVADGVGGWRKSGIDGGEYARQLMHNSLLSLRWHPNNHMDPKQVLEEAYRYTSDVQGSSTACIVSLSGEDRLRAANVGDSGFLVVRNGGVHYKSPKQQRSFNCPYQLGPTKDDPRVAEEIEIRVEKGDTVVLGTDGLLDNVHEWEILEVLQRGEVEGKDLTEQCCYMANVALYNSFDKYRDTPYSIRSRKAGKCRRGGKVDDITVIIARIH